MSAEESDFEVSEDSGTTWRAARPDEVTYDQRLNRVMISTPFATRGIIRQSWGDERPSYWIGG